MEAYLDEPLRRKLNHGACETISRIHMADFHVENTLGLKVMPDALEYYGPAVEKDKITLEDFIGNTIGEGVTVNNVYCRNSECVEEFAVIFRQQYESMLEMGMLDGESQELRKYLNRFASMGEYDHKEDQPFYKELLSNVLDLTIIKPIIESSCGYDLITGEDMTEMGCSIKLVGAIVDLVTLATGLYGFSTAVKTMGGKKATAYFAQLALVELASDVSAATAATIGEHYEWPAFVTLLLNLGTGITVGQVGNHLMFKRNGIEIFRKEVGESGGILDDNPVLNWMDEDVLVLNNGTIEGGSKTYAVDPSMQAKDIEMGVLIDGAYIKNPTAQNMSDLIKPGSNYVGNSKMNGRFMYVVDANENIIIGSRTGQHMPHPTLVGGTNPTVQGAGILEIRGGKFIALIMRVGILSLIVVA